MREPTDGPDAPKRGLSRRELIRGAAVAGAAAWTAPLIVESLASPAAAGTAVLPPGRYWYLFKATYSAPNCTVTLQSSAQCTGPSGTSCNNNVPSVTRIEPGQLGDTVVVGTFNNCTASGIPLVVNQGICWTTTQAGASISGIDLINNVSCNGTAGFGGCFTQPACNGAGSMLDPNNSGTVNQNFSWYPIIQILVT